MKQILTFIAGVITGALLMIGIGIAVANEEGSTSNNNPQFFDSPGECMGNYKFKIFQALEPGYGLAHELKWDNVLEKDWPESTVVLFYSPDQKPFYDDQVIKIPKGACAKQIGIYKYATPNGSKKTVPVIQILKK